MCGCYNIVTPSFNCFGQLWKVVSKHLGNLCQLNFDWLRGVTLFKVKQGEDVEHNNDENCKNSSFV